MSKWSDSLSSLDFFPSFMRRDSRARDVSIHPNINHKKKVIFIHIPKNAGTSIFMSLGMKRAFHSEYRDYANLLGKEINNYFTFCFVRNPFSRFVSLYNYARMAESYYHSAIDPSKKEYGKHLDYDLLINKSLEECAIHLANNELKHDKFWNHWRPQATWIKDLDGAKKVTFIGKVENLDLDIYNLNNILNLEMKNQRLNQSNGSKDYRNLINANTKRIITEYYKEDLELFGYSF